nr:reverse transcriptase domain-containing protein [Tanacetum cinerariifolium]
MIIEAKIGCHYVHRMYVDGRSALKVMYEHYFSRLCLEIKKQLIPATTPLIGFSGEIIWLIGLGVRKLQAVPSTTHGMLKIPVERGVITLKRSKLVLLEYTMVFGPGETSSAVKPITEERVKVAINPEYPKQMVMIGSTHTEGGRNKLRRLLQRNLEIFAWKPADMTGVLRHIVKHRLIVREGCSPVRQKKRGQADDRNQAIQEEARKLVEAGIMREVHYHDWLSNLVMVKKMTAVRGSEEVFKQMKQLIVELPMLTIPMEKDELIVYLAATKALRGLELNYTSMEKLVLALVHASKCLK